MFVYHVSRRRGVRAPDYVVRSCVSLVGSEIRNLSPAIPALLCAHSLQRTRSRQVVQPTPTHHPTAANHRANATRNQSPKPLKPEGKLVDKYCKEWADKKGGIRHGYQAIPDALDYYSEQMTANCDNLE